MYLIRRVFRCKPGTARRAPNRSPVEPPLLGAIGHLIPGQMCGKVAYHLGDVGLMYSARAPWSALVRLICP